MIDQTVGTCIDYDRKCTEVREMVDNPDYVPPTTTAAPAAAGDSSGSGDSGSPSSSL